MGQEPSSSKERKMSGSTDNLNNLNSFNRPRIVDRLMTLPVVQETVNYLSPTVGPYFTSTDQHQGTQPQKTFDDHSERKTDCLQIQCPSCKQTFRGVSIIHTQAQFSGTTPRKHVSSILYKLNS